MNPLRPRSGMFLADETRRIRIRAALLLLRDAWEAARDVAAPPEEFALEINEFFRLGLSCSDLRWLIAKGQVLHLRETTRRGRRTFCKPRTLKLGATSCFVLASPDFLASLEENNLSPAGSATAAPDSAQAPSPGLPRWDEEKRLLVWRGRIIKSFRVPAPNQELILSALEQDGWPPQIDDPLPVTAFVNPKVRLHDAIKGLNRHQVHRLLRFEGNGNGRGVCWRLLEERA